MPSDNVCLRAKTIFKTWSFYFAQFVSGIVEKQHVSTPFNFFFKFLHRWTLFPVFSVHVNWAVFYVTKNVFNPNKAGHFEDGFFYEWSIWPPIPLHISKRTNLISI